MQLLQRTHIVHLDQSPRPEVLQQGGRVGLEVRLRWEHGPSTQLHDACQRNVPPRA
jgi:hypothetical protein